MKKQIFASLLACACLAAISGSCWAQKTRSAQPGAATVKLENLPLPEIAPPDPATAIPVTEQAPSNIYASAIDLAAIGGQQKNPTYLIAAAQLLLTAGAPGTGTVYTPQAMQIVKIDPADFLKIALEFAREKKDKDSLMQIAALYGNATLGLNDPAQARKIRADAQAIEGELSVKTPYLQGDPTPRQTRDVWVKEAAWRNVRTSGWLTFANANDPKCQVYRDIACTSPYQPRKQLVGYFAVTNSNATQLHFISATGFYDANGRGKIYHRIDYSPDAQNWQTIVNWTGPSEAVQNKIPVRQGYYRVVIFVNTPTSSITVTVNELSN